MVDQGMLKTCFFPMRFSPFPRSSPLTTPVRLLPLSRSREYPNPGCFSSNMVQLSTWNIPPKEPRLGSFDGAGRSCHISCLSKQPSCCRSGVSFLLLFSGGLRFCFFFQGVTSLGHPEQPTIRGGLARSVSERRCPSSVS